MPRDEHGVRAGVSWSRRWWRALLAELVATALLVLLGVASLLPVGGKGRPLTHPALGFAFVVTALVQAFGGVSGAHMNPAVTLAAVLYGQLAALPAAAYVLAQLLGGTLGFGALLALAPAAAGAHPNTGVPEPAEGVTAVAAACVEALLTGVLALACCGLWAAHDPARPDTAVPTKLGLTIGGLVYAGGELSGASLNPARTLGPALLQGYWRHHWVYWVGPLGGAALGALLHRWVLCPRVRGGGAGGAGTEHTAREELPLHDKPEH